LLILVWLPVSAGPAAHMLRFDSALIPGGIGKAFSTQRLDHTLPIAETNTQYGFAVCHSEDMVLLASDGAWDTLDPVRARWERDWPAVVAVDATHGFADGQIWRDGGTDGRTQLDKQAWCATPLAVAPLCDRGACLLTQVQNGTPAMLKTPLLANVRSWEELKSAPQQQKEFAAIVQTVKSRRLAGGQTRPRGFCRLAPRGFGLAGLHRCPGARLTPAGC
jgi:hypothetical protein